MHIILLFIFGIGYLPVLQTVYIVFYYFMVLSNKKWFNLIKLGWYFFEKKYVLDIH